MKYVSYKDKHDLKITWVYMMGWRGELKVHVQKGRKRYIAIYELMKANSVPASISHVVKYCDGSSSAMDHY